MNKVRPVNLNLLTIKQPIMAIISILHRISGIMLLIALPYLLCLLSMATHDQDSYISVADFVATTFGKITLWLVFAAFAFHWVAGLRHMVMDMGYGETLRGGRLGAYAVLVVTAVLVLFMGSVLW
ncbi:MAG: succinate dehydrogenase, cytochrome b556 subunit [Pseudomonadota bacterium]|nr:succinate dehydrogenase, cytochrome b556 subunit [Pseudomonadota bacterium]